MNFRPLGDMILVKPDLIDDKIGSVYIPQGILQSSDKPGDYKEGFIGTVVAIGPGDRHAPYGTFYCSKCHKKHTYHAEDDTLRCGCAKPVYPENRGAWEGGRHKMYAKVGDRVIYPRRANMPGGEFSVIVDREKYVMMHEEQCCLGVLEA